MQMIGSCDSDHVDVGKVRQHLPPRLLAEVTPGEMIGPTPKLRASPLRGAAGLCRNSDKLELDRGEFTRPAVKTDAAELRADAGALDAGVSAQVSLAAEHPGAHQTDGQLEFRHKRLALSVASTCPQLRGRQLSVCCCLSGKRKYRRLAVFQRY